MGDKLIRAKIVNFMRKNERPLRSYLDREDTVLLRSWGSNVEVVAKVTLQHTTIVAYSAVTERVAGGGRRIIHFSVFAAHLLPGKSVLLQSLPAL